MLIHSPNKEILFINGQPFQAALQWRIERMHPHRHAAISASQKYRQSLAYLLTTRDFLGLKMHTKALGDRALIWVASFDGPSAFPATLLILYFCCVLVRVVAMWKINSLSGS